MKKITVFYQKTCPYCKKAIKIINELKSELPKYSDLDIEFIEENENKELAAKFDYWFVPTFYIDNVKLHEGVTEREDLIKVFEEAIK